MAGLYGMHSTCSMSELGIAGSNVPPFDKDRDASIKGIKNRIKRIKRRGLDYDNEPPQRQRKAIICNTIYYADLLLKCGFKDVAQYNGNDGEVVHVMLYIAPKSRIKEK